MQNQDPIFYTQPSEFSEVTVSIEIDSDITGEPYFVPVTLEIRTEENYKEINAEFKQDDLESNEDRYAMYDLIDAHILENYSQPYEIAAKCILN